MPARTTHVYWRHYYHAETGPDSWQGGYDSSEEAHVALLMRRATMRPDSLLDPGRWVVQRVRTLEQVTEEP